ncbi:MAG: LysM domain-containing protein [Verrucomicrobia bacterium]|nr:MAG: LysM domain-containing protein [Verrucomicrobiota bacterium]
MGFTGCDRVGDARFQKALSEADKRLSSDDLEGAVRVYESVLDGTPKTAEAHYRLGHVYSDRLKEPLGALYHFNRYVAVAPDGPYAKGARAYKKEGELLLVAQLGNGAPLTQEEAARLKNENLKLRKTLEEMRLLKTPQPTGGPVAKGGEILQKPIPPGARTHKIASGETLATIAIKYYKNKGRAREILDANFYSADAATKLKVGQDLYIP